LPFLAPIPNLASTKQKYQKPKLVLARFINRFHPREPVLFWDFFPFLKFVFDKNGIARSLIEVS
jgi:hypothetical protein